MISVLNDISFWIFWRHTWDVCALVLNNSDLFVYLSVCSLAYFLTEIRPIQQYVNFGWYIPLNFFGDIPGMLLHHFKIILNFLYVCQSVSWLTSLLKLDKYRDISGPEWAIFLKFFGDIPRMLLHHSQIILNFLYGCQSFSWLTSLPN